MQARAATLIDLSDVLGNSAERMSAEYVVADATDDEVFSVFTSRIQAGCAHALTHQEATLAVLAWEPLTNAIMTSFAAREDFFATRHQRFAFRHVRRIKGLFEGRPLVSYSYSVHPRVERWFGFLGFEEGGPVGAGRSFWLR